MQDIKVGQLSHALHYNGKASGIRDYLERVRANHSAEKGVVIKDFGGPQNIEAKSKII